MEPFLSGRLFRSSNTKAGPFSVPHYSNHSRYFYHYFIKRSNRTQLPPSYLWISLCLLVFSFPKSLSLLFAAGKRLFLHRPKISHSLFPYNSIANHSSLSETWHSCWSPAASEAQSACLVAEKTSPENGKKSALLWVQDFWPCISQS